MSKIAVINESNVYNLGTEKICTQLKNEGNEVFYSRRADLWSLKAPKAYISGVFTWDLPKMCHDANLLRACGIEVEIGGPAATAMPDYVEKTTGVIPHFGVDLRFEHVKGEFRATFSPRGCRNKCPWCIVPKIEPEQIEYDDFNIPVGEHPMLNDNNLLATSWEHQERVVEKLRKVRLIDINSGFEAALFTEEHYDLYSQLPLRCWRLAFDSMAVEHDFERAVTILKKHGIRYHDIMVYALIGFPGTTIEENIYRLEKARSLGCSPYPQLYMPLNKTDARHYIAPGFDASKLKALRLYWLNPFAWRTCSFDAFEVGYKTQLETIGSTEAMFEEEKACLSE